MNLERLRRNGARVMIRHLASIAEDYNAACADPITREYGVNIRLDPYVRRFREAMGHLHSTDVDAALELLSLEELREIARDVDSHRCHPTLEDPEDFCTVCNLTPTWWEDRERRKTEGYNYWRPEDPEDGPGRWQFHGRDVICNVCLVDEDVWPDDEPWQDDPNDPLYEKYCLGMSLIGWILNKAQESGEAHAQVPRYGHGGRPT